ncbi:sodium-dependent glucose transporter 1 [Patella vulgata]|uniref:sodium-dependent glucose transporter 1 n=1 Tax=Patella vulgata TaxID=6465 RepID=UPI00217FB97C|nr:sodium-dependent glucose transporter 1 [Patella vulgata]
MENEPESFRFRIIQTVWLFYGFFLIGFNNGILGPTLIDLQILVQVEMNLITYIFFVAGAGFIMGILLCFVAERYCSLRVVLAVSIGLGSVVNIVLTLSSSYVYLMILFFLQGCTKGIADYAIMTVCNSLWKDSKGVSFQFVALGGGIASFLAPFIAEPFLAGKHSVSYSQATVDHPIYTLQRGHYVSSPYGTVICTNYTLTGEPSCYTYGETQVQGAYIIIGILSVPPAIAFAYYYYFERRKGVIPYEEFNRVSFGTFHKGSVLYLSLLFLFHIPIFGLCLAYGDLLSPFGVEGKLQLNKSKMATMTSLFWGSFLLGRVANLVLSRYLNLFALLLMNFAGLLISVIVLVVVGEKREDVLWIGTSILGVFAATYLPTVLAWSDQFMPVTGSVISTCLVASGIGEILIPFIGGKLFDSEGPGSLMTLMLVTVVYEIAAFVGLVIVGNFIRQKTDNRDC